MKEDASVDLIRRCQAGDQRAFAELFHRYKNLVYKTAYLILEDPSEAEEVLQDVFVPCGRYRGVGSHRGKREL